MHQNSADCVLARTPIFASAGIRPVQNANRLRGLTGVGELRRVREDQDGTLDYLHTLPRCLEVSGKDRAFIHPRIGQESIRRLGARPVLTGQRDGLPELGGQLPGQPAEPPTESLITEPGANEFPVEICCCFLGLGATAVGSLPKQFHPSLFWRLGRILYLKDSLPSLSSPGEASEMWVIDRLA